MLLICCVSDSKALSVLGLGFLAMYLVNGSGVLPTPPPAVPVNPQGASQFLHPEHASEAEPGPGEARGS